MDTSLVKLVRYTEGECVQMMHIGPFSDEVKTVAEMHRFIEMEGLRNDKGAVRKHHEIYLSDPRKTIPEKNENHPSTSSELKYQIVFVIV